MGAYRLVEAEFLVAAPLFPKEFFFGSGMGVKVTMGKNFESFVFPEISQNVPAVKSLFVASRDLEGLMTDAENMEEIRGRKLFTADEWTQVLYSNTTPLKRESQFFRTDRTNISYLELKNGLILMTYAVFDTGSRWRFGANPIDNQRHKDPGRRLFSRAQ